MKTYTAGAAASASTDTEPLLGALDLSSGLLLGVRPEASGPFKALPDATAGAASNVAAQEPGPARPSDIALLTIACTGGNNAGAPSSDEG